MNKGYLLTLAVVLTSALSATNTQPKAPKPGSHSVYPYVAHKSSVDGLDKTSCVLSGLGYKYSQELGYNAEADMAMMQWSDYKTNGEIYFHNSYKFSVLEDVSVYPYMGLKLQSMGVDTPDIFMDQTSINSFKTHLGAGVSKSVLPWLEIGVEAGLGRDLFKESLTQYDSNIFATCSCDKHWHYEARVPVRIIATEAFSAEITPQFTSSFDGTVYEKKAKLSVAYTF